MRSLGTTVWPDFLKFAPDFGDHLTPCMQMPVVVIRRNIMKTKKCKFWNVTFIVTVLLISSSIVQAQSSLGMFHVDFNANPGILASGGSSEAFRSAGWNSQTSLTMDFNSVALRIYNDASSTTNLTEFALTIGDVRFNFANFMQTNDLLLPPDATCIAAGAVAGNDHIIPLDYVTAMATTLGPNPMTVAAGDDAADRVVINFGNGGIAPGYSALFELRFEFDDSIPIANRPTSEPLLGINNSIFPQHFPSYQRILFDSDTPNPTFYSDLIDLVDSSDNAMLSATFANGEQSAPQALPDQIGFALSSFVDPSHPRPNFITPSASGIAGMIPEPMSCLLFLTGALGLSTRRYRPAC